MRAHHRQCRFLIRRRRFREPNVRSWDSDLYRDLAASGSGFAPACSTVFHKNAPSRFEKATRLDEAQGHGDRYGVAQKRCRAPGLRSTGRTLARWRPSSRVLLWLLEKCRWQLFFRRPATLPVNPVDPADRQQHLTAAQPHAQQRRYSFCDQLPANPSGWGSQNGISSGNHDCSQHTSAVSIGQG